MTLGALVDLGYEHVPEVGGRGEFARRGGIVDVFPAGQPMPVRIDRGAGPIASGPVRIAAAGGPTKVIPAASHASTSSGFPSSVRRNSACDCVQ